MSASPEIILIIDDNEENRYTFGRYLKKDHFEVWTAKTGAEGMALAKKNPSLIMLDIQLPDTTGYELCRILKSDPATSSIPVLHTSATFTESSDKAYGLEGGADGYLTQPIDAQELNATVRALLRVRAAERAARGLASQWQTTFDSISDALCLLNPAGEIERFNRAFTGLFSDPSVVQAGQAFTSILSQLQNESQIAISNPQHPTELMIRHRWYRVAHDPIKDARGQVVGSVWSFSDINSIREADLKLQNLNRELEQRVSDRTTSLQDAVHQLEQFFYAVSHDLRAPLRAMHGYSNALLEDYSPAMPEEAKDYLQRIATNTARLDKMIVDVLTFTRISKDTPSLQPIPLEKLVLDIIEHYPGLKSPKAEIQVDVHDDVVANESGLMQALSNLLGNAVKFVKAGVTPKIRVWSERRGEDVRIWVEDNGIGISPEYQKRLFGMFERVLPSSEYEGTGVGLAITRKVVERMKGTVGMESDGLNGSKFWIQLRWAEREK
jgi:signal transduction histidine kinase